MSPLSQKYRKKAKRYLPLVSSAVPFRLRLQERLARMERLPLAIDELKRKVALKNIEIGRNWMNHPTRKASWRNRQDIRRNHRLGRTEIM